MTVWNIDASHTNVGFSVKHMMISKVKGSFSGFTGAIEGDPENLETANVSFTVDMNTIHTSNEDRDNHLRSADFFDTETFPEMTFVSTKIEKTDDDEYDLTGDLTIKGVTKQVTFEVEYEGKGVNPWGQEVVAFSAEGKIDRKEFGLTWNQALETGGFLVGDTIKISIELEANPAQEG
ncbi:YceI family protein [Ornithinibacillus sp. 4-3]|uniref:YceI family protein n=1 Tax=Ornithinibacillus sp. 4-3 TaxID=3231488 RepID=A0AB39HL38_9BACI